MVPGKSQINGIDMLASAASYQDALNGTISMTQPKINPIFWVPGKRQINGIDMLASAASFQDALIGMICMSQPKYNYFGD